MLHISNGHYTAKAATHSYLLYIIFSTQTLKQTNSISQHACECNANNITMYCRQPQLYYKNHNNKHLLRIKPSHKLIVVDYVIKEAVPSHQEAMQEHQRQVLLLVHKRLSRYQAYTSRPFVLNNLAVYASTSNLVLGRYLVCKQQIDITQKQRKVPIHYHLLTIQTLAQLYIELQH